MFAVFGRGRRCKPLAGTRAEPPVVNVGTFSESLTECRGALGAKRRGVHRPAGGGSRAGRGRRSVQFRAGRAELRKLLLATCPLGRLLVCLAQPGHVLLDHHTHGCGIAPRKKHQRIRQLSTVERLHEYGQRLGLLDKPVAPCVRLREQYRGRVKINLSPLVGAPLQSQGAVACIGEALNEWALGLAGSKRTLKVGIRLVAVVPLKGQIAQGKINAVCKVGILGLAKQLPELFVQLGGIDSASIHASTQLSLQKHRITGGLRLQTGLVHASGPLGL